MNVLLKIAAIPYYLTVLFAFLIWFTVLCPFAFMTDCSITNETDAVLSVTPIGSVGREGHRTLLPLYRTSFPFFVKSKLGDFQIPPNSTFRFSYDMDDVNFSELVIENSSGEQRQIIANSNPTQNRYRVPDKTDFVVDDFDALTAVPVNVKTAAIAGQQTGWMWIIYTFSAVLLSIECLRRWIKR